MFAPPGCRSGAPRALDLSNNSFQGTFPTWLLPATSAAMASCSCPLYVAVNGPAAQLACPPVNPANLLNVTDVPTIARMGFSCFDTQTQQQVGRGGWTAAGEGGAALERGGREGVGGARLAASPATQ